MHLGATGILNEILGHGNAAVKVYKFVRKGGALAERTEALMNNFKRENWWLATAALIAGVELFVAGGIWFDRIFNSTVELYEGVTVRNDLGPLHGDVVFTGAVGLAAVAIITGLYVRSTRADRGHWLILAGLVPAALAGIVLFWFPPFWVLSVMAIAVIVRLSRELTRTGAPIAA